MDSLSDRTKNIITSINTGDKHVIDAVLNSYYSHSIYQLIDERDIQGIYFFGGHKPDSISTVIKNPYSEINLKVTETMNKNYTLLGYSTDVIKDFCGLIDYVKLKDSPEDVKNAVRYLGYLALDDSKSYLSDAIKNELINTTQELNEKLIAMIVKIFNFYYVPGVYGCFFSFTDHGCVRDIPLNDTTFSLVEILVERFPDKYYWGCMLNSRNTHKAFKSIINSKIKEPKTWEEYYLYFYSNNVQ